MTDATPQVPPKSSSPLAEPSLMDGVKDFLAPLRFGPGFAGRRIMNMALLLLVLAGSGSALFLTQKKQDIRQQAAGDSYACTTCLARTRDEVQCRVECGGGAGSTGGLISNVTKNIDAPLGTFLNCMDQSGNTTVAEATCLDRAGYDDVSATDRSNLAIGNPTNYFANPQGAFYKDLVAQYPNEPAKVQEVIQHLTDIKVTPPTTFNFVPKPIGTSQPTTAAEAVKAGAKTAAATTERTATTETKVTQTVIGPIKQSNGTIQCTCQNSKTNDLEACSNSAACCSFSDYKSANGLQCGVAQAASAISTAITSSVSKISLSSQKVAQQANQAANTGGSTSDCSQLTGEMKTACQVASVGNSSEKLSLTDRMKQTTVAPIVPSTTFDSSENKGCTSAETARCANTPTKSTCYKNPTAFNGEAACISTTALTDLKKTTETVKTISGVFDFSKLFIDQGPTNDCGPFSAAIIAMAANIPKLPNGKPLTETNYVDWYKQNFTVGPEGSFGNQVAQSLANLGLNVKPLFGIVGSAGAYKVSQEILDEAKKVNQNPAEISKQAPNGVGAEDREKIAEMKRQLEAGNSLVMSVSSFANTGHYVVASGLKGCGSGSNFDPYDPNCKIQIIDTRYSDHSVPTTIKDGVAAKYELGDFNMTIKQVYVVGKK